MPGAEPLIERHCPITAVVALEISVMEMVEIALANRMSVAVLALPFVVTDISFVVVSPNPTLGNNFNSALVRLPRGNCCHGGYDWGTNNTLFGSASHLAHTFTLV